MVVFFTTKRGGAFFITQQPTEKKALRELNKLRGRVISYTICNKKYIENVVNRWIHFGEKCETLPVYINGKLEELTMEQIISYL